MDKKSAIGLSIALAGAPVFVALSEGLFGESPPLSIQIALQIAYCAMAAFLVWFVLRVERLSLRSIGLKHPTAMTVVSGIGLLLVSSFVVAPLTVPLQQALHDGDVEAGMAQLAAIPMWFRLIVGITAGIVEEISYRGYAIERLITLTGKPWLAGIISAVIFGLAHVPGWGLGFALAADLPFGLLMSAFYIWRRDLFANILAHSAGLVIAMFTVVA